MKLTRCSSGHFYDADKYPSCPQCSDATIPVDMPDKLEGDTDVTVSLHSRQSVYTVSTADDIDEKTVPLTEVETQPLTDDDERKTVGFFDGIISKTPTAADNRDKTPSVGWLVCIAGEYVGYDFRLCTGRNSIGRAKTNSICLSGDAGISREPQVIIVYEPVTNRFFALPGTANELAYINNEVLLERVELHKNDLIELGKTKLMLIPLCDENFTWKDMIK